MATISEQSPIADPAPRETGANWLPANPAPLGLCGFGLTTIVLSLINANLLSGKETPVVLGMALAYGGLAQFLAGMWEFRTGNTFGAVAFTSYGAFWISFFVLVMLNVGSIPATLAGSAVGAYLWVWGILTGLLFLCTFRSPLAVRGVFLLLTITFILLGIGNSGGSSGMVHAGGYFGLVTGALALYTATAEIMAHVYGRDVIPIGRPAV